MEYPKNNGKKSNEKNENKKPEQKKSFIGRFKRNFNSQQSSKQQSSKDVEKKRELQFDGSKVNEFSSKDGRLKMVAISGAEEIGMNMTIYTYEGKDGSKFSVLVDCGITFENLPGATVVMPDLPTLIKGGLKIDAIILTHAHEDHIGALAYLYEFLDVPMYATPFTVGLIERKFKYARIADYMLEKVSCGESRQIGPFNIKWIATTHSIPDSAMLAIEAGGKRVLHTGDWRIDPDPVVGPLIDHESLIAFGKKGIHALVGDSTNIQIEESPNSEGEVGASLKNLISKTKTGRFVLTCFASNVARVQSCIAAAQFSGRKVLLLGTSLQKSFEVALELGYITNDNIITQEEANELPVEKLLIICTGSQGEENSALWKIANKMRTAGSVLEKGDTIVFSARVIDGRQHDVRRIINQLVERGVRVLHPWNSQDSCIHASGHPAKQDIAQLLDWTKPNYVIPVHSEAEHRISHIAFAKNKGYKTHNLRNGHVIEIAKDNIIKLDILKHEKLVYDGNRLVPNFSEIFKKREEMRSNGVVVVSCGYKNKQQVCIVTASGIYDGSVDKHSKSHQPLAKLLRYDIERVLKKYSVQDFARQDNVIRREIVKVAKDVVKKHVYKVPNIICHILG